MTMQMNKMPEAVSATRFELTLMAPPKAPIQMPKQVLTPPPGQFMRALRQIQSRLTPGRESTRRAG